MTLTSSRRTTRTTEPSSRARAETRAGAATHRPTSPPTPRALSPTSTKVVVTTDLHITGKVAQFGRGILGDVSTKLIDQFADNLNTMIDEDGIGSTGADAVAEAADDAVDEGNAETAAEATEKIAESPKESVRKINGPAADPIDLMDVSGSSILKRAAPAFAALLVILFFLRRRS